MPDQIIQAVKGITAVTAATAPNLAGPVVYGSYLTSHGVGLLSYSEIIQVIGAFYVSYLLIKALINSSLVQNITSKIKSWLY